MNEIKDSIANVTTIAGAGSAIMNWNEVLTGILIVTGIVLNIQRIMAQKKRQKKEED
jgi:hypothetical protein